MRATQVRLPMEEAVDAIADVPVPACTSVSRYCLKAGDHCRLPPSANGTPYHARKHVAYATAEMRRPYPLGIVALRPGEAPNLRGQTLEDTV